MSYDTARTGHGVLTWDVTRTGYSQSGNYSTLHYKFWFDADSGYGGGYDAEATYRAEIDPGNHVSQGGFYFDISVGGTDTICEGDVNVGHDAEGYCRVTSTATATVHSGSTIDGTYNLALTMDLPRIPKPPDAPTVLGVDQATAHTLRYQFRAADMNGANCDQWQAQRANNSTFTSNPYTVSATGTDTFYGLVEATTYWFRSRGHNVAGWGPWSAASSGKTLAEPAGAPTGVTVTVTGGTTADLSWVAPTYTGGEPIDDFYIQFSRNSDFSGYTSLARTGNSTPVTNLIPGALYYWRVAARNSAGIGTYSTTVTSTQWNVPSAPLDVAVVPGARDAVLTWSPPERTNGSTVTGYEVQYSSSSTFSSPTTTAAATSPATVGGLTPGLVYWWRVRALSDVGASAYSDAVSGRQRSGGEVSDGVEWATSQAFVSDGEGGWRLLTANISNGSGWKAGV